MVSKKWCFTFELNPFGFTGEHFPVDEYLVSDEFILLKRSKDPEHTVACLIEDVVNETQLETIKHEKEKDIFNFVSIYNLFTPVTLTYTDAGYQTIDEKEELKQLIFGKLRATALLTPERQEEDRKRILETLDKAKSLLNY